VIASPALDVTPADRIVVDGAPLPARERTRLFLYHKPRGLVTTHADPQGRSTVFAALPRTLPRLLSVGRLDANTEGLLLLTNDGGLARALELPATGWMRRYRVRAHGRVRPEALAALRQGISIDGIRYGAIEAQLEREQGDNVWLTFAIREGKNREVKNVLGHLGLAVNRLIRVSFGPFQLGDLATGAVEEVRTRHLREQLSPRILALSGADFAAPIAEREAGRALPGDTLAQESRHSAARQKREQGSHNPNQRAATATASAHARNDKRKAQRAPADERPKQKPRPPRGDRLRRRDAERLGEPALARRERHGRPGKGPKR
jgi:23S rRNA pseudouridine2605 synthase